MILLNVWPRPGAPWDVLPLFSAPADEKHSPGSSDEDTAHGWDGGAKGRMRRWHTRRMGCFTLHKDADLNPPLSTSQNPNGLCMYVLLTHKRLPHSPCSRATMKMSTSLRLGIGWPKGTITRRAQKLCTRQRQHTHGVAFPLLTKYFGRLVGQGSWVLVECLLASIAGLMKKEVKEEEEEEEMNTRVHHQWRMIRDKGGARASVSPRGALGHKFKRHGAHNYHNMRTVYGRPIVGARSTMVRSSRDI